MTLHGIADLAAEIFQRVGLGVDGLPHGLSAVKAVVGFLHQEEQLAHHRLASASTLAPAASPGLLATAITQLQRTAQG